MHGQGLKRAHRDALLVIGIFGFYLALSFSGRGFPSSLSRKPIVNSFDPAANLGGDVWRLIPTDQVFKFVDMLLHLCKKVVDLPSHTLTGRKWGR